MPPQAAVPSLCALLLLLLASPSPSAASSASIPGPIHPSARHDAVGVRGGGSQSQSSHHGAYDFDRMSSLVRRLDALESAAASTLAGFYDARLGSFSVKPGSGKRRRVCVTSTCYALLTLALSGPGVFDAVLASAGAEGESSRETTTGQDDLSASESPEDGGKISVGRVLRTLVESEVREDDLFQVPLLLYTLLRVDADRAAIRAAVASDSGEEVSSRMRKLLSAVLGARPERHMGSRQDRSDYIGYQVCKVLALLKGSRSPNSLASTVNKDLSPMSTAAKEEVGLGGLPVSAIPPNAEEDVFWALLSCSKVSSDELCRQLAYLSAGDRTSFDPVRLAYSLLTYIRSTESLQDMAGRELVPGEGPARETRVAPLNQRLVEAALSSYFAEQNPDGLWEKGQPIYVSFRGGRGRTMGGAFVFSVNTLGSLLCALPAERFRSHLGALERTLEWIENHETVEMITDHCDPDTGVCHGRPLRGWNSPHHDPWEGPQAWPTAQVLKCVNWMSRTIRQLMHKDVLEEFNGVAFSEEGVQTKSWDRLLDTDLGAVCEKKGCRTIKSVLEERVVRPFQDSIDDPSIGAAYSAILFGPPGTAKTSICEALAQRMGYDFCVIDTAAFLADGLTNVAARIRYVFSRLMALDKCVILFDEIEEFALDRETPGISMESRMLTTAMLTAINDLRRTKKSVFFVATNRVRFCDHPARKLEQKLAAGKKIDEEVREKAICLYRDFLESVWSEDAMFMNYLEGMQFASVCADIVLSGRDLTKKEMTAIMKRQAAVMTVRGPAREEFLASMELTRL
ncbi:hypothetical protein ACHAWF_018702 [Thalassiosira exigua]